MDQTFRNKTISGMIWKALESGGNQGITIVISIVLARMLDPENYTTLALLMIFVTFADVFVKRGFATALIQKKDADNVDFSSALWVMLALAGAFYALLFFGAPFISGFYEEPLFTPALRMVSLSLFFGAFTAVQGAIVQRKLEFRKFCMATLGATLISGAVGIYMAYAGYGVWALVVRQLLYSLINMVLLWLLDRWKPSLVFSMERVKSLFGFGWKLLASSLLESGYKSLSGLVIAKRYIGESLAFYNRGRQFPSIIGENLNSVALAVLFPAYARHQSDQTRVREMVRKTNRSTSLMIFPMMAGLAAIAPLFILVLFTEKWMPAVPFLQLFCIEFAFYPMEATDLQAINAIGRSDIYLRSEIIKKVFGILALATSVFAFTTPLAIAGAVVLTELFSVLVTMFYMKRLFNYGWGAQLWDILPPILLSAVMAAAVYAASFLPVADLLLLVIQIVCGVAVYLALAVLLKLESFQYLWRSMKEYLTKNRNKTEPMCGPDGPCDGTQV
ncbi:MAG: lipopolysaccharide biosynthesis protein [Clostridiales bacterium]|nr:lipopolysaccharide biosynthesis protein [Clostridiales bacterium]